MLLKLNKNILKKYNKKIMSYVMHVCLIINSFVYSVGMFLVKLSRMFVEMYIHKRLDKRYGVIKRLIKKEQIWMVTISYTGYFDMFLVKCLFEEDALEIAKNKLSNKGKECKISIEQVMFRSSVFNIPYSGDF